VQAAIDLGAKGYVLISQAETVLLIAVEMVMQGKQFFSCRANGNHS
jgi:DNA-binding NarL/FixJ family response regulator